MRLLLFTLLCVLAILLIRAIQGLSARRSASPEAERPANVPPAASPDEIVDVRFEEVDRSGEKGERS